jgi:hypothetical protein|tara:strand:+ start:1137 stop:1349 length:213 start_codon:yes stop_codon:yes gene_type:complete
MTHQEFRSWIIDEQEKEEREAMGIEEKATTTRICMMCSKVFESESKVNRICSPCKRTDDWTYGNDYGILR